MPPNKLRPDQTRVQVYPFTIAAGEAINPAPANPRRNYLAVQVDTGGNPVKVNFGRPATASQGWTVATSYEWALKTSVESVNLFSTAGATGTIIEGNSDREEG